MAGSINIPVYSDALVVLGTAGVIVPLVHRWGLSPVLGYLGAGVILGPLGLGSFVKDVPLLYWFTVVDAKNVSGIADLGIVFLMFLIGLELSYERLWSMRRLVFGLGGAQVLISTAVIAGLLMAVGQPPPIAVIVGAALAMSSTAIVLEVLSREGRLPSGTGRSSFAVLLAQDLAIIPLLMLISIYGAKAGGSLATTLGLALMQALATIALIVLVGRIVLRPLFRLVARTQSSELFIAAVLFVIIGTGVVAAVANLSMALGAFIAGLLLAETEYRKAVEATMAPVKGLLLGIFFFTVGMGIDVRELAREPVLLLACVVGLIAIKAAIVLGLARAFGLSWPVATESALLLGPGGEFALVAIGLAVTLAVVPQDTASFAMAVTSVSMALIPLLSLAARRIVPARGKSREPASTDPALLALPALQSRHVIVVGYGRVGKVVCDLLARHDVVHTAVDNDANTVGADRARGRPVYFGDASNPAFLKACGVMEASAVVITIHSRAVMEAIVREVRALRSDIPIVARARDAKHARELYRIGVTDAVPETIEASLQLSEAALVGLGIPAGPVIASIHEARDEFRHELQEAAREAGHAGERLAKTRNS